MKINWDVYSEEEIEMLLERKMDNLDDDFICGRITEQEYDFRVKHLETIYRQISSMLEKKI